MKTLAMKLAVALLNFVYLGIRLLPVKNKILFISRQANVPSHDIDLLVQAVKKQMPEVQAKVLTKTLDAGLQAKLGYCLHLALQMYHIATSRAVILDGYCIAASVLTHKKETVFIQMWHASCALKKFGWQTVGRSSGSSRRTASIMKMHRNYNYVLTSSKRTGNTYCEGFHISENQLIYIGMPHYTMLVGEDQRLKRRMTANYPQLKGKINILYIPTFRKKGEIIELNPLTEAADLNKYNLIVRPHDLSKVREAAPEIILDKQFSTYDWIRMADAVITDYSSLALETAIAGKPLYFYIRDIEAYKRETGLNICFEQEKIGKYAIKDIGKLMETIKEPYDYSALEDFKKRYMEVSAEHAVDEFVAFIKTAGGFNGTI